MSAESDRWLRIIAEFREMARQSEDCDGRLERQDKPAVALARADALTAFYSAAAMASHSMGRLATAGEDIAKSLALITRELEAARTFRERERRGGR